MTNINMEGDSFTNVGNTHHVDSALSCIAITVAATCWQSQYHMSCSLSLTTINRSTEIQSRSKHSIMQCQRSLPCNAILPVVSAEDKVQEETDNGTTSAKNGRSVYSVSNAATVITGAGSTAHSATTLPCVTQMSNDRGTVVETQDALYTRVYSNSDDGDSDESNSDDGNNASNDDDSELCEEDAVISNFMKIFVTNHAACSEDAVRGDDNDSSEDDNVENSLTKLSNALQQSTPSANTQQQPTNECSAQARSCATFTNARQILSQPSGNSTM
jgi:hypothetical protein